MDINKSTTLFLDRDGVINKKLEDDYVKCWEDFEFIPGVLEALSIFNNLFGHIFIVTNQQGIGKGLMKKESLEALHVRMMEDINSSGGRIDKIYYCPDLSDKGSHFRKPNIGMALQARKEFEGVNLKNAIIAGDSISDMRFGRKAKMLCVFISSNEEELRKHYDSIDYNFPDLISFARFLTS